MQLRPHHLLCTQCYEGKGYSEDFVNNMDKITARLRSEKDIKVTITASTDDICAKCPLMEGVDLCTTNDIIKPIDSKVMQYFGVEEKQYAYHDIIREINKKMTPELLDDICGKCSWYPVSACKDILLARM